MGFEYYSLLDEHPAVVDELIPVGVFTRWGQVVEPGSVAVDVDRELYFLSLYSYWDDSGVRSAIVLGGRGWRVEFMAVVEAIPIEAENKVYKYKVSIAGGVKKSGSEVPAVEFLSSLIAEAVPVYNAKGFVVESVDVEGWGRV